MMKKYFSFSNLLLATLLLFVLFNQAPILINNFQKEGATLPTKDYLVLTKNGLSQTVSFPGRKKLVVIFWATWCGPCQVEMKRLATSVKGQKISKDSLIAINPFEDTEIITKFLRENSYANFFTFIKASDIASNLDIRATPTTIFIEDSKVVHMSSGMSLIGILKAERFLSER